VANLTSKSASGIPSWDELSENTKSAIEFEVMNEKKAAILAAKMKGSSLTEIAKAVNTEVKTSNNTTLATSNIESIGNEPAVVGRAFGLAENEVSAPVTGNIGVFVVMLKSKTEAPLPDNFDQQKQAALGQLRGQAKQRANQALVETSGMEDNREKVNIIGN